MGSAVSGYFRILFDNLIADLSRAPSIGIILSALHLGQDIYKSLQIYSFFSIRIFDKGVPSKRDKDVITKHLTYSCIALLVCSFVYIFAG